MVRVRIIIIQDNNLWGVISGGKFTNRVYRGKKMADGSGSEVQKNFLFGKGLLSMIMGGRLKKFHNHMERGY